MADARRVSVADVMAGRLPASATGVRWQSNRATDCREHLLDPVWSAQRTPTSALDGVVLTGQVHCDTCCHGKGSWDEPLWLMRPGSPVTYGRNEMAAALADAFYSSGLLKQVGRHRLRLMIGDAWVSAEFPTRLVDDYMWSDMYNAAGFVTDCRRLRSPRVARTLWRGCMPGFELGMSWTDHPKVAQRFAEQTLHRGAGHVVSAVVPADMVLARFVHSGEAEWVLDPECLDELEMHVHDTPMTPAPSEADA